MYVCARVLVHMCERERDWAVDQMRVTNGSLCRTGGHASVQYTRYEAVGVNR